jgi:hypothetical protein
MSAGMVYHCICAVHFCLRCSLLILGHLMTVSSRLLVKLQKQVAEFTGKQRAAFGRYSFSLLGTFHLRLTAGPVAVAYLAVSLPV